MKLLPVGSCSVLNSIHISGYVRMKVKVRFFLRIFFTSRLTETKWSGDGFWECWTKNGIENLNFVLTSSNLEVQTFLFKHCSNIAVVDHGQKWKSNESNFEFILMVTLSHYVRSFHVIEFASVPQGTFDKIEKNWKYQGHKNSNKAVDNALT